MAAPDDSQNYLNTNVVPVNKQKLVQKTTNDLEQIKSQCVKEVRPVYGNRESYWKQLFPKTAKETVLNKEKVCSFYLIIAMLQETTGKLYTIAEIKTQLWQAYSDYMGTYGLAIENILLKQGKVKMIRSVQKGLITFETAIMSEDYYITNLDLWILANKMKLPMILFCEKPFKNMVVDVKWLILSGELEDTFYFVRSPIVLENNIVPVYQFLQPAMKLDEVKGLRGMIESGLAGEEEYKKSMISLDTFLAEYKME